jgi:hypothetical protein
MTLTALLSLLDTRLEDPGRLQFPVAARIAELDAAQLALLGAGLDSRYLTSLQHYATSVTLEAGASYPLSGFNPSLALDGKGVIAVKAYDTYGYGYWAREIKTLDVLKTNSTYLRAVSLEPYYWLANGRIYVLPSTTTHIDCLYYKVPTPFSAGALTAEPELNEALHPLMATWAEMNLWASSRDFDRMNGARARVELEVAALNGWAEKGKPEGIGYDEKGR